MSETTAVRWGWFDKRTGERVSASSGPTREWAERQLAEWLERDAKGGRPDLHDVMPYVEVRSFKIPHVSAMDLLGIAPNMTTDRREADAAKQLRAELADTRAALDRARDTAALLESGQVGAIRPQVLNEGTPEPERPWRVVFVDDLTTDRHSLPMTADQWWREVVNEAHGRPVYVISAATPARPEESA